MVKVRNKTKQIIQHHELCIAHAWNMKLEQEEVIKYHENKLKQLFNREKL